MAFSDGWARKALILLVSSVVSPGLAGAQALPPVAAGPPAHSRYTPARINGTPSDWVTDDDYPAISLRDNVTGTVKFRLSLAADGSPSACEVLGMGVNAELNQKTCDLVMRRAHFFPATDPEGKPVMGSYSSSVKWQIPDQIKPYPTTYAWQLTYDIHADGTVANCSIKMSGLPAVQMAHSSEKSICPTVGPFAPLADAPGKPSTKHVVINRTATVSDSP